ncbi:MAG: hypothetical protein IJF07_06085 [Lachnospiraceae bacterium]|nr:hypothetical protein [Lachnospiraceae bacterium]
MSVSVIVFEKEEKYIKEFIKLPRRLYGKRELMQNVSEERAILLEEHPFSHYFAIRRLLAVTEEGRTVGRAILTIHPGDTTAFLGFYESEEDTEICKALVEQAEKLARKQGCDKLVGPVDASFWIRYRFKTSHFGSPYTGEPYNKEYYKDLWQQAGFQVTETYYSNRYRVVGKTDDSEKFKARLAEKLEAGYVIKSPYDMDFQTAMLQVYDMIITLYSSFPVYKYIGKEEFVANYSYLQKLLNYDMVKLAYYQEKPVGFFISIPNYGNLVYGKITLFDLVKILQIKKKPKDYVMLYMGVDREHAGLGKALAETIKEELKKHKTPSVGALIRKGNINKDYFKELIDFEYEYVLMEKKI